MLSTTALLQRRPGPVLRPRLLRRCGTGFPRLHRLRARLSGVPGAGCVLRVATGRWVGLQRGPRRRRRGAHGCGTKRREPRRRRGRPLDLGTSPQRFRASLLRTAILSGQDPVRSLRIAIPRGQDAVWRRRIAIENGQDGVWRLPIAIENGQDGVWRLPIAIENGQDACLAPHFRQRRASTCHPTSRSKVSSVRPVGRNLQNAIQRGQAAVRELINRDPERTRRVQELNEPRSRADKPRFGAHERRSPAGRAAVRSLQVAIPSEQGASRSFRDAFRSAARRARSLPVVFLGAQDRPSGFGNDGRRGRTRRRSLRSAIPNGRHAGTTRPTAMES